MERVSELILRNAARLQGNDILLLNPARDTCYRSLAEEGRKIRIFTQDFGDYDWFLAAGADAEFGNSPVSLEAVQEIILVLPKERARLHFLLHSLAAAMPPTAGLWLVGENRSGIKSSAKHLDAYFERVTKMDNARHCSLISANRPKPVSPFQMSDYEESWSVTGPDGTLDIISLPGTFAHGRLDPGTRLLLSCLQELSPTGCVLDFACGSGVIGLTMLDRDPAIDMTLLDTSALALESVRRSLLLRQMKATVLASDGLTQLSGQYDWIVSNPPFHRGVENDLSTARAFCEQAHHYLTQKGKILLVCNRHLPYASWLKLKLTRVDTIKSNREFKVILASGHHH